MQKKILIQFLILFLVSNACYPQIGLNKVAQSTMNFLLVSTSPRASAIGEAFTTLGTGSESMFYNPAGLAIMKKDFDININYTQWIADINYLGGGVAYNLGNYGAVGLNVLTVDYGEIHGTSLLTEAEKFIYQEGFKENGLLSNVGAYSIGISYAKSISTQFSIGGTVKLVGQNLGESLLSNGVKKNNASKLAFDAGVRYLTGFKSFGFGMMIRNFASNIKREELDEQLPLMFTLGAGMNIMDLIDPEQSNSLYLAVDFVHQNNFSERVNFGMEFKFMDMLSVRGGYQTNRDLASWSGGIGLNTSVSDYDIELNYSYSRFEIFDSVSRLSLVFTL